MSESVEVKNAKTQTVHMNHGHSIEIDPENNEVQVPGHPYIMEAMGDKIILAVDRYLSGYECKECKGAKVISKKKEFIPKTGWTYTEETCPTCNGKGGLLVIPETSKTLPTTGVVVSIGPDVTDKSLKRGHRVLTGAYVGTMIPIRGGELRFKCVREHEVQLRIRGGEELAAFDFIEVEDQSTESY